MLVCYNASRYISVLYNAISYNIVFTYTLYKYLNNAAASNYMQCFINFDIFLNIGKHDSCYRNLLFFRFSYATTCTKISYTKILT